MRRQSAALVENLVDNNNRHINEQIIQQLRICNMKKRTRSSHQNLPSQGAIHDVTQDCPPAYRLAFADHDFLLRDELRSERLQLEFLKPELSFQFHYFAIRKMHFTKRAKALVACLAGSGTLDELFETLTDDDQGVLRCVGRGTAETIELTCSLGSAWP